MTLQQMLDKADPLFTAALTTLLASKIAPTLRQDGQDTAQRLLGQYKQIALPEARRIDAGERKLPRYDIASESNFNRSRFFQARGR